MHKKTRRRKEGQGILCSIALGEKGGRPASDAVKMNDMPPRRRCMTCSSHKERERGSRDEKQYYKLAETSTEERRRSSCMWTRSAAALAETTALSWPTTTTPLSPWAPKSLCQVSLPNRMQTARPPSSLQKGRTGSTMTRLPPSTIAPYKPPNPTTRSCLKKNAPPQTTGKTRTSSPRTSSYQHDCSTTHPVTVFSPPLDLSKRHGQATRGASSCASPSRTPSHRRG